MSNIKYLMSNVQLWLLLAIVVFAAVLRIWGIGQFPAGLNADEAAIGYNAYSLIQTGKDEDRKSTRLNSSHSDRSRMPSSA